MKTDEIQIRSIVLVLVLYQFQFPGFDGVLRLCQMLSLGKIVGRVNGNFLCFLCTFLCTIGGTYTFGKFSSSIDKYYGQSLTLTYIDQQFYTL